MEIYNSEQEQVEALKAWWDKNGRNVLVGLGLFLLSVLGWQAWNDHRTALAEEAAAEYQLLLALMPGDAEKAMTSGRALITNYPGSAYAALASLAMAKLSVDQQDLDGAAAHLRAAMEQNSQPELAQQARVRLARVELAQGKPDAALATLDGGMADAASSEVRGDVLLAQGDRDGARDAYAKALEGYTSLPEKRQLVQMKLDDLAQAKAAGSSVE